jgi:uncharacterized protein YcsI (UPF0317 family)
MDREELKNMHPSQIRTAIRSGRFNADTVGLAEGYVQANLVVVSKDQALDFLIFCQRNPQPCPVLEVTDTGQPALNYMAKDADIRTDLAMYRIWERGRCVAEVENITEYWTDNLVGFLLGCSWSFDWALLKAGIRLRHMEQGNAAPTYLSSIECKPAGVFHGPMVVTMRPILKHQVSRAVQVSSRYPAAHGAPVHVGDPTQIGIASLQDEYFGETGTLTALEPDEVPVFWGCGVTPQAVAIEARLDFMISHFPGRMFITDVPIEEIAIF